MQLTLDSSHNLPGSIVKMYGSSKLLITSFSIVSHIVNGNIGALLGVSVVWHL